MGVLTRSLLISTGNAAPNYVPYTEARTPFGLNAVVPARLSGVVKAAVVEPRDQNFNNAPYVNDQTWWAAGVVKTPQGFVRRR